MPLDLREASYYKAFPVIRFKIQGITTRPGGRLLTKQNKNNRARLMRLINNNNNKDLTDVIIKNMEDNDNRSRNRTCAV